MTKEWYPIIDDGCRGCEKICPKKAITHHSDSLKKQTFVCSCGGNCK